MATRAGRVAQVPLLILLCLLLGNPHQASRGAAPSKEVPVGPVNRTTSAHSPRLQAEITGPTDVKAGVPAIFTLKGLPQEHLRKFDWLVFNQPKDAMVVDLLDRQFNPTMMVWSATAAKCAIIADVNVPPNDYRLLVHEFTIGGDGDDDGDDGDDDGDKGELAYCVVVWEASDVFHEIDGKRVNYGAITASKSLRATAGNHYEVIDKDATNLSARKKMFLDRYKADKRAPWPWIYLVAEDGTVLHEQRHPSTVAESIALMEKYQKKGAD